MSDDMSIPNPGYRAKSGGRYGIGQGRFQQGMDPDTRRLVMFAGGLGAVLLALIGASALVGRHGNEVPVITADSRPVREKPINPGGMKIEGAENDVFSGGSDTSNARLAPRAETPNTSALQATIVPPPVMSNAPLHGDPMETGSVQATPTNEMPAVTAVLPPVPAPMPRQAAVSAGKPAVVAVAPPAAKPAQAKPAAAVTATHPGVAGHQPMVQLAAVMSEEAAKREWEHLSHRMPDLLKGHQPNYSRTEHDGHTFWRIRTTGFADAVQARNFCEQVRTKGGGCSVADF